MAGTLLTPRLSLEPMTLALVEACFRGDRAALEDLARAKVPAAWPGRALVERAFSASIESIRSDPPRRLWGDRLMITRDEGERLVVGSVVFHGRPEEGGIAEVGYGVEPAWQRKGIASEGTRAVVEWAIAQPGVGGVTATTPPWHGASIRVLENAGLVRVGTEDHEALGEVLRFTRLASSSGRG
ncbi:MAG: acetyltransferase, family [Labilithrix sp.]|nr:acetyltransferase, family [Labilithrix sp.]